VVPNTILIYELTSITVETASQTATPPFSRLHGGQAKRPRILICSGGLSRGQGEAAPRDGFSGAASVAGSG
jgi:hypothetical protein